ncbi:hypothetical protein LCGC14_1744500 [marine sediment metagenome]|uniref:Uncharacterized protein n=1 Tax=marine sediment metagenome TaxID=412755 RepID=A0A0F9H5M8_9ZZZZ
MPLFDGMYFDQKWSLWDTFPGFARNIQGYLIVAGYRMGSLVTARNRRENLITAKYRRGQGISGG